MLYWTDAKKRVVLSAHKISGKNGQVLLKRQGQPFGVKVSKLVRSKDVEMGLVLYNTDFKRGSLHVCPRTVIFKAVHLWIY